MGKKLTPDDVLNDLREATYISTVRIQPTNPKFTLMVQDAAFTTEARDIIAAKIERLKSNEGGFQPGTSARGQVISNWQRLLAKLEDSLHKSDVQPLR